MGSNEELFWFDATRRRQSICEALAGASSAAQLMPIEPQWLLDAWGSRVQTDRSPDGLRPGATECGRDHVDRAVENGPLTSERS
jgi:hypothetical protein